MSSTTQKTGHIQRTKGFTILELLVATMVFSMVLLMVTAGILQISRVYYKGVTEGLTQNTARNIIDTISQNIQFSGEDVIETDPSPIANSDYRFCVGSQQFTYRLGWQVENQYNPTDHQAWHGLVQRDVTGCASAAKPDMTLQTIPGISRDLVGRHMRVSNLVVKSIGANRYQVLVRVVYGDDDLLNNPIGPNAGCSSVKKGALGTQFCSSSELSTIVVRRVQ